MRIVLVTLTDQLEKAFAILNPANEYCAIVVDEVEPAEKILESVGLPKTLLYPFYDLQEFVDSHYYDALVCFHDGRTFKLFPENISKCGVPKDKFVDLCFATSWEYFLLERALQYYKERVSEFEMFATGLSHTTMSLDVNQFKRKLFNFARGGQDIYYNYQIAKFAVLCSGGGCSKLRYALVGLTPIIFHWNLSKASGNWGIAQYAISFGDMHNFWMPAETYLSLFSANYLSIRLPTDALDRNNVYLERPSHETMTWFERINALSVIRPWNKKNYPETRAENVQILDDYLTLCEGNDIRPIMFLPPMTEAYVKYFNRQRLDEFYYLVECAIKKHPSAIFIDGWQLTGFTDADFYDVDHLNLQGAAKFSAALNGVIEQLDGR